MRSMIINMIKTADNICEEWGLTRRRADEFALKSQQIDRGCSRSPELLTLKDCTR